MKRSFGILPTGEETSIYTICGGGVTATVTDYGASLVSVLVPDGHGGSVDVALGYDDCNGYRTDTCFLGAVVGRNANRIAGASFSIRDQQYQLVANEGTNNLHSGPDFFNIRMWKVTFVSERAITLVLHSPEGDQGFPGNADIQVTYELDDQAGLHIRYKAVCDQDTVFNLTNHSYFNLAGQDATDKAMDQTLMMPSEYFTPDDAISIPTGELRSVKGSPMDFRIAKPICRDLDADYEPLHLQGGYDHNWLVNAEPCAILSDPVSGRSMQVSTDCPGIQFYAGNFLDCKGKNGVYYGKRSGVALETQFYPDALHHSDWPQPVTKAGDTYHSETVYTFSW